LELFGVAAPIEQPAPGAITATEVEEIDARETLALLFSGISYGRSRDSNEIGGTISIHPVIDELSRVIKSFYPLFVFTVFLRENGLKQDVNVAWPFGALPESPGLDQKKAL